MEEVGKIALNTESSRLDVSRLAFRSSGTTFQTASYPFGEAQLLIDPSDKEISRTVFIQGKYERLHMQAAISYLQVQAAISYLQASKAWSGGKTFLDVGANIGTATIDALLRFGFRDAVCFEPEGRNFRLLRLNLLLNDLDSRASAYQIALSDRKARAILERSSENFGDTRVRPLKSMHRRGRQSGLHGCVPLDSLVAEEVIRLDDIGLVWIDTQGHEASVLAGATAVTGAGNPIVLEYWPKGLVGAPSGQILLNVVQSNYRLVIDLGLLCHGLESQAVVEASNVEQLLRRYGLGEQTDLLLLR